MNVFEHHIDRRLDLRIKRENPKAFI
jgi:hypothetical protein